MPRLCGDGDAAMEMNMYPGHVHVKCAGRIGGLFDLCGGGRVGLWVGEGQGPGGVILTEFRNAAPLKLRLAPVL